jgi:hypothetical protein
MRASLRKLARVVTLVVTQYYNSAVGYSLLLFVLPLVFAIGYG